MRAVVYRERVGEDDEKSIRRVPNAVVTGDTVTVPSSPKSPIVVWGRPSGADGVCFDRVCPQWPLSWDKRCHNCAHFFEGVPVPLPVSRDELRSVYFCEGKFCSWQCAKSFNMRETSPAGRGNRNMYIAVLAYKTWIKFRRGVDVETREKMKTYCNYSIDPAPPRSRLVEFGGSMTIEEYRKDFCGVIPPSEAIERTDPFTSIRRMSVLPFIDTDSGTTTLGAESESKKSVKRIDHQKGSFLGTRRIETNRVQEFNNSFVDRLKRARADPEIMSRKKELDVSNTLVSSMGIKIKKRSRR